MTNKYEREEPWDFDEFYEEFNGAFYSIALRCNYPGSGLEADDIVQSYWEMVWAKWDDVSKWQAKIVITNAKRKIATICKTARIETIQASGGWIYTRKEVVDALYYTIWSEVDECPDVEARIDLHRAVKTLGPAQRHAMYRHFALVQDIPNASEKRNYDRGVENVVSFLNINYPAAAVPVEDVDTAVNMTGYRLDQIEEF